MILLSENDKEIWFELPSGERSVISSVDKWIFKEFPTLGITASYVFAERKIKTEYSTLKERILIHRLIAPCAQGQFVDHIDRNKLNNRRSNLRFCNRRQNMANTGPKNGKKFKGVYEVKNKKNIRFVSYMDMRSSGGKRKYLGYFKSAEDAAKAYDAAAKEVNQDFAYLNFPEAL